MAIFNSYRLYVSHNQRVNPIKSHSTTTSYGFPMVFPWFSYGPFPFHPRNPCPSHRAQAAHMKRSMLGAKSSSDSARETWVTARWFEYLGNMELCLLNRTIIELPMIFHMWHIPILFNGHIPRQLNRTMDIMEYLCNIYGHLQWNMFVHGNINTL